jgi:hypothetical protein
MAMFGRRLLVRQIVPWAVLSLTGLFAGPAQAFFPPSPVHVPSSSKKPPIVVPKPPVIVPPTVTPPGGGTTTPPDTNPEPASLVLALLGGAGVSLFAAYRRQGRGKKCKQ